MEKIKPIPLVKPYLSPREEMMPALEETLYSGYIAQGPKVEKFEKIFSNYLDNENVIALNSGTSALHLALLLAGVGPGDEVISTAMTAEPTNMSILMAGANIVWADVDSNDGNICAKSVETCISDKTKAIIVVDYAGYPVDLKKFQIISEKYNIPIIEDAAHALGSRYGGARIGNHSNYVIFSFQAIKHLTTVDGGVLVIKDKSQLERARKVRWFGLDKSVSRAENQITEKGFKYNMNDVTATLGIVQMRHIDQVVGCYIENGRFYDEKLANVSGIETVALKPEVEPSYWLYTIKVDNKNDFVRMLNSMGIAASEVHKRNDLHPIFNKGRIKQLPQLDEFYKKLVHIPCGWWVGEAEREYIVSVIKKGW